MPQTICLDFDGVLNDYSGWLGPDELFKPRPGAREFCDELRQLGYRVVIHSTRPAEKIREWCQTHQIVVDGVTDHKPPATCYVDDRGIGFDGSYADALFKILNFKAYWERAK